MKVVLCLGLSVSIFAAVAGTVHTVPGDFESVAAALAAESVKDGDTIQLAEGRHAFAPNTDETTHFDCVGAIRKGVTVTGAGRDLTIVDAQGCGGFIVDHPEALLCNMTVTNFLSAKVAPVLRVNQGVVSNVVVDGHAKSMLPSLSSGDPNCVYVASGALVTDSKITSFYKNSSSSAVLISVAGGTVRRSTISGLRCQCAGISVTTPKNSTRGKLEDCILEDNGIMAYGPLLVNDADVSGCVIRNNKTSLDSAVVGGVYFRGGFSTFENCVYTNNTLSGSGSCLMCYYDAAVTVKAVNCLVARNLLKSGGALGLQKKANVTLTHVTLAENTASSATAVAGIAGNGASGSVAKLQMLNSIVWNNRANGVVADFAASYTYANINLTNCCFRGFTPTTGENNVDGDPCFADVPTGDFTLGNGSSCIDQGADAPEVGCDLSGKTRPQDGNGDGVAKWDIGCYEADPVVIPLECTLQVTGAVGEDGGSVTQKVTVVGTRLTGLAYTWFAICESGGSVVTNQQETSVAEHVFDNLGPGTYSFAVVVRNDQGNKATDCVKDFIRVPFKTCYVSDAGSDTWPYTNVQMAARQLASAISVGARHVAIEPGTYSFEHIVDELTGSNCVGAVHGAMTITGSDNPADVVIDCGGLGGVILDGPGAMISGVTFTNYLAKTGSGPTLYLKNSTASNIIIRGGTNISAPGTCLYVGANALATDVLASDCSISGDGKYKLVNVYGGTLRRFRLENGKFRTLPVETGLSGSRRSRVEDSAFVGNRTTYVSVASFTYTDLVGCSFVGNYYQNSANASNMASIRYSTMSNCVLACNRCQCALSLPWVSDYANKMTDCLIVCNTNTTGGAIYLGSDGAVVRMTNCTIADNVSQTGSYAGIYGATGLKNSSLTAVNCIVWNNRGVGDVILDVDERIPHRTVTYSCFAEAEDYPDAHNLCADPKFRHGLIAADGRAYKLRGTSPCIDVGDNLDWTATDLDLSGNPRIILNDSGKGIVDLGCYECPRSAGLSVFVR